MMKMYLHKIVFSFFILSFVFPGLNESVANLEYERSWAIIIGIDEYENENIPDLRYATNDAVEIKSILIDLYGFNRDNVTTLLDGDATLNNIKSAFNEVIKNASENDRILIYFAGHGETQGTDSGGELGYLVPQDGDFDNLFLSSFPMTQIRDLSSLFKAKHVLYLIDACYSGLATRGYRGGIAQTDSKYHEKILGIKVDKSSLLAKRINEQLKNLSGGIVLLQRH